MRFDYHYLYLQKFLRDTDNPLAEDEEFIIGRADLAGEEFETLRRCGTSVAVAQESAMAVLMDGF